MVCSSMSMLHQVTFWIKTHWHTIFQDQKCNQHAITHSFFGLHICWSRWSSSRLLHMPLSMQTKASQAILLVSPSLSSYTWLTLTLSSPYPRRSSLYYLQTSSSLFWSSKQSDGCISSTIFLGSSHTNSNCSQTHKSTGHCTCIFIVAISKRCTEAQDLQKPMTRIRVHHNLNSRWNVSFHSRY